VLTTYPPSYQSPTSSQTVKHQMPPASPETSHQGAQYSCMCTSVPSRLCFADSSDRVVGLTMCHNQRRLVQMHRRTEDCATTKRLCPNPRDVPASLRASEMSSEPTMTKLGRPHRLTNQRRTNSRILEPYRPYRRSNSARKVSRSATRRIGSPVGVRCLKAIHWP
jgi:hypothetical protein